MPHRHGGPGWRTFAQQLQLISHYRTLNDGMIQNLNLDFNTIRLQTIMESIQRMAPESSLIVALAQQGVEAVNFVVAQ
jgi:hypothetical protein